MRLRPASSARRTVATNCCSGSWRSARSPIPRMVATKSVRPSVRRGGKRGVVMMARSRKRPKKAVLCVYSLCRGEDFKALLWLLPQAVTEYITSPRHVSPGAPCTSDSLACRPFLDSVGLFGIVCQLRGGWRLDFGQVVVHWQAMASERTRL